MPGEFFKLFMVVTYFLTIDIDLLSSLNITRKISQQVVTARLIVWIGLLCAHSRTHQLFLLHVFGDFYSFALWNELCCFVVCHKCKMVFANLCSNAHFNLILIFSILKTCGLLTSFCLCTGHGRKAEVSTVKDTKNLLCFLNIQVSVWRPVMVDIVHTTKWVECDWMQRR
jgi:hypothetical protein